MKYDRIHEIEVYLQRVKTASNQALMEHFKISMQTLRRDLKELEDRGVVHKVYGGVVSCEDKMKQNAILDVNLRNSTNMEEKQSIGRLSATCVEDQDIIFIDSGTTAFHMIPYLTHVQDVTIISHSLHVLFALREMNHLRVICLGGVFQPDTWTYTSDSALHPYNYNKAFISTVGISLSKGFTNTDFHEGALKRMVMRNANEVYVLADASKFGNVAFQHFADFEDVDVIVCDTCPDDTFMNFFKTHKIKVLYK